MNVEEHAATKVHPMYRPRRGLDEGAIDILRSGVHTIIGTVNRDGTVHLTPVMYLFDAGTVYIETSAASRKARNIGARARATVLVQDPRTGGTSWVSGSGRAHVLTGAEAGGVNRRIRSRYLTDKGEDRLGRVMAIYDDATIAVTPEKWMSWDTSIFDATVVEHGVSLEDTDGWFHPVGK